MIDNNHSSKRKNINLVIGLGKSGFWAICKDKFT